MARIAPWLALIVAAAVAVISVVELDRRADDDGLAIEPTTVPSPLVSPSPPASPTPEATAPPEATPEDTALGTEAAPAPTVEETQEPDETVAPTPTVTPPRTPTPAPALTPGPVVQGETTPHTGGSSVGSGLALAGAAGALRVLIGRRRRS